MYAFSYISLRITDLTFKGFITNIKVRKRDLKDAIVKFYTWNDRISLEVTWYIYFKP
jgi:hypothetical protein